MTKHKHSYKGATVARNIVMLAVVMIGLLGVSNAKATPNFLWDLFWRPEFTVYGGNCEVQYIENGYVYGDWYIGPHPCGIGGTTITTAVFDDGGFFCSSMSQNKYVLRYRFGGFDWTTVKTWTDVDVWEYWSCPTCGGLGQSCGSWTNPVVFFAGNIYSDCQR